VLTSSHPLLESELHDHAGISDDEFAKAKAKMLGGVRVG